MKELDTPSIKGGAATSSFIKVMTDLIKEVKLDNVPDKNINDKLSWDFYDYFPVEHLESYSKLSRK